MIWPPAVYQLSEKFGVDPRQVATWPERVIRACLGFGRWEAIKHEQAKEEARVEAEIEKKRSEAKSRVGKRPPRPHR